MNTIVAQLKKHTSITLLALAIMASTALQAMEQPKDLIEAATDGDLERVKALINAQADVNQTNINRDTALMRAIFMAKEEYLDVVKALINAQADVNLKNKEGNTPLIMAAFDGHLEIVKTLINAQADVNFQGNEGATALMAAAEKGHLEIVKTLINAHADIDLQDNDGFTALMLAAQQGHLETVKALLTNISDKDSEKIKNNFTGLLALNRMRFMPKDIRRLITQKLIQELVDERMKRANEIMGITNEDDQTAQDVALAENHKDLAALLDPQNAESQQKLRAIIENKIRRILFGEPTWHSRKWTRELIDENEAFGSWDKNPSAQRGAGNNNNNNE